MVSDSHWLSAAGAAAGPRILVTGGTGLVGQAVVAMLLRDFPDCRPRVPYRGDLGAFHDDPRVEYVRADLTERDSCRGLVVDCVGAVLCAATTGGAAAAAPAPSAHVTDKGLIDLMLFEGRAAAGVGRVIYMSSAIAYQDYDGRIHEGDMRWDLDPPSRHFGVAWVKRFAEKMLQFWHHQNGLEVQIFRLANVFGPFAKFAPENSNVIPALIRKAVDGIDPFIVWGHGAVARDFVYTDDVAEAVKCAILAKGVGYDVFNIGAGAPTTVAEVTELALAAAGHRPSAITYQGDAPTTVAFRALDCGLAQDRLQWRPRTDIATGIQMTTAWWRENKDWWVK